MDPNQNSLVTLRSGEAIPSSTAIILAKATSDRNSEDISNRNSPVILDKNSPSVGTPAANGHPPIPTDMDALLDAATDWDKTFMEATLDVSEINFEAEGLRCGDRLIPMDQSTRCRLLDRIGAPVHYFEKRSPSLQAAALNEDTQINSKFGLRPKLVFQHRGLVTIANGSLFALKNFEVIHAVREALGADCKDVRVTRFQTEPQRIDIELISPVKEIAVRPGDIVQAGLHIAHERYGTQATVVEMFAYRLVCSNGMTRRDCPGDRAARTRRLPLDRTNSRELQMAQVRRLTAAHWESLQEKLQAFRSTGEQPADVKKVLENWLQRAGYSDSDKALLARLLAAWRRDGEDQTLYGAINALTWVATHDANLSARQRRTLASLAGLFAFRQNHLCEHCFSILKRSAA